jgi:hypothetical protein
MGEPLHNVDPVINAVNILTDEAGMALSHNKVTVSTSGLVPEIRRFCREAGGSLAVSLNATTDEVRPPTHSPHCRIRIASRSMCTVPLGGSRRRGCGAARPPSRNAEF